MSSPKVCFLVAASEKKTEGREGVLLNILMAGSEFVPSNIPLGDICIEVIQRCLSPSNHCHKFTRPCWLFPLSDEVSDFMNIRAGWEGEVTVAGKSCDFENNVTERGKECREGMLRGEEETVGV